MSQAISELESNLQEIYFAIRSEGKSGPDLVANWNGTHLYHGSVGWGRLWKWFYSAMSFFLNNDIKMQKMEQVICRISHLFHNHLENIVHIEGKKYEQHLLRTFGDLGSVGEKGLSEEELVNTQEKILEWAEIACLIVKLLKERKDQKLFHPFNQISNDKLIEKLEVQKALIELEKIGNKHIPLKFLLNLCLRKNIDSGEGRQLQEWIKLLNKSTHEKRVYLLHQGLSAFVHLVCKNSLATACDVEELELSLLERGCFLLLEPDSRFLQWRSSLKKGVQILFNSSCLTLGAEIGGKADRDDTVVFELEEDPTSVLISGNNLAMQGLKKIASAMNKHSYFPYTTIRGVDSTGRFLIAEKLKPLENPCEPAQLAILSLFSKMVSMNFTPSNFSLNRIMIDSHGVLKSFKIQLYPQEPHFNFNRLESMAFHYVKTNPEFYKKLMEILSGHRSDAFYKRLVRAALNEEEVDVCMVGAMVALRSDHTFHGEVTESGKELVIKIREIEKRCHQALQRNVENEEQRENIASVIKSCIGQVYKESLAARILPDEFESMVMRRCTGMNEL